jgi:hypothetical protein
MSQLAQIAISVAATLTIIGVILVTTAWLVERARRREIGHEVTTIRRELDELRQEKAEYREQVRTTAARVVEVEAERDRIKRELENVHRVAQNRLYRESLEDHAFAGAQAALRIRAMREELDIVERLLSPKEPK